MSLIRKNLTLDSAECRRAQKLAVEAGVSFNAYVRDAIERLNLGLTMTAHFEQAHADVEGLLDEVRRENVELRLSVRDDLAHCLTQLQVQQRDAIARYEDALKEALRRIAGTHAPRSGAPLGPPTSESPRRAGDRDPSLPIPPPRV